MGQFQGRNEVSLLLSSLSLCLFSRNLIFFVICRELITHGSFVEKEIIALYQLKKYRALKNRYMGDDPSKFGQAATLLNEYMDDGKTGSTDSIISKT